MLLLLQLLLLFAVVSHVLYAAYDSVEASRGTSGVVVADPTTKRRRTEQ